MFGVNFYVLESCFQLCCACESVGFLSGSFLEEQTPGKSLTKSTVFSVIWKESDKNNGYLLRILQY